MTLGQRLGARLAAALLPFALLAALASNAFAHAAFLESDPAPGTRLEEAPRQVSLTFTEPLVRKLTQASLVESGSGRQMPATVAVGDDRRLVLRPHSVLPTGAYRIAWHTVSPEDGHALEGSIGFGVRTDAATAQSVETSPLARGGWLRVAFRAVFYAALVFFAGGVLTAVLLAPGRDLAAWLVPEPRASGASPPGWDAVELRRRLSGRTVDAGWLALSAGVATVTVDALDAGGGLSVRALEQFLLSNVAGLARVGTVVALLAAVVLCARRPALAAGALTASLGGIALAGHANSADLRLAALLTDWIHLVAGSLWLGGIAQVAFAWWRLRRPRSLRAAVMRDVLGAFGRVALPSFAVVVTTGLVNAAIQLGGPEALWTSAYGRALGVKVGLVVLIALASYVHAVRLRPRLLAASDPPALAGLERRHWRLLRAEPVVGASVVAVAALLVTFPLPPRQLVEAEGTEGAAAAACDPCPQPAAGARELAVAEQAGSRIVAAWIRRSGTGLAGEVRVLDRKLRPVAVAIRMPGAQQQLACGRGCWRFRSPRQPVALRVAVPEGGHTFTARLPVRWRPDANARAARLLSAAQSTMRDLRSVREEEEVTSGPGTIARTSYRLRAPDRMALRSRGGVAMVIIGNREWYRAPGVGWRRSAQRPLTFRTRTWFRWTPYGDTVRLLDRRREGRRKVADLALFDRGTPAWYRLVVDRTTRRVLRVRLIARAHFMRQRLHGFNRPVAIRPPA